MKIINLRTVLLASLIGAATLQLNSCAPYQDGGYSTSTTTVYGDNGGFWSSGSSTTNVWVPQQPRPYWHHWHDHYYSGNRGGFSSQGSSGTVSRGFSSQGSSGTVSRGFNSQGSSGNAPSHGFSSGGSTSSNNGDWKKPSSGSAGFSSNGSHGGFSG